MSTEKLLELHMQQDKERFDSIDAKLDSLIAAQNKQRGFIAGFSAAFSVLATMLVSLVVYVWQKNFGA